MQKAIIFAIAGLACACHGTKAPPCSSASGSTVTVQGLASQRVKPDTVTFSVGVESRAASVVEAVRGNSQKVAQVLIALKAGGARQEDIQTAELDVSAVTSNSGAVTGFRVSNLVTVIGRDVGATPALIQAAFAAGANQLGGLQFSVADKAALQRKGQELALADARARAQALASLSSRNLGAIVCVSDARPPESPTERLTSLGYTAGPPLMVGTQETVSAVSVVFELK
jgi:uncharacterized protein